MRTDVTKRRRIRTPTAPARVLALATLLVAVGGTPVHAQVGTWNVEGRVKILACLGNQCVADSARVSGTSTLNEDGTYRAPNLGGGCLSDVPDEVGRWRLEGSDRIVFEPTNVQDIIDATLACFPQVSFELRDYTNRGKIKKVGQLIKGKARLRGRVTVQGQQVAAKAVLRWRATPALAATATASRRAAPTTGSGLAALVEIVVRE